ncbi:MAG: hypothetical protein WC787_03845 [Patescibacteria group bacterium]|jgi:hypothetical protein
MSSAHRASLLKTLTFHETWGHAPTAAEWMMTLESDSSVDPKEARNEIEVMQREGLVVERLGRFIFPESVSLIDEMRHNELFAPRKRRTAGRVAAWLARLGGVRFVALCNTTALGHARDESDLDFFVITRAGTLMQTRALATLPFKLAGRRPGHDDERDAVCLSYFVSDDGLDLSSHMLGPDDPYFRYWFLSLVPLYDDGVSRELWKANRTMTTRHPCAMPWEVPPDFQILTPSVRIPFVRALENIARTVQTRAFPASIREFMNRDTRVIVNEKALKFHVTDGRDDYRRRYNEALRQRAIV